MTLFRSNKNKGKHLNEMVDSGFADRAYDINSADVKWYQTHCPVPDCNWSSKKFRVRAFVEDILNATREVKLQYIQHYLDVHHPIPEEIFEVTEEEKSE